MANLVCRKCGRELHNTFDLCPACRAEQERQEDHQKRQTHALEMAAVAQEQAAFEQMREIDDRSDRASKKEQEKEERDKKRHQLAAVNAIITAADTIVGQTEGVPADRGVQLDTLAKLANLFPSVWEGWHLADTLVPHRAEVAYARHRASVAPLLAAVLAARADFPISPDRLLRTLATSFLFKDFGVIRRVQRDLPSRLAPIRQRARDVVAVIKEKEAAIRKLKAEWQDLDWSRMTSLFSAMKGRTKAVVESEIGALDSDIVKEKQVIARLEDEAKQAKRAFELSHGDPAMRSILEAIGDEVALLEAVPTVTDAEPQIEIGQPSFAPLPEADGAEPEQVEVEPWEVARRWASRHQHVVFWLLVGLTFPLGLIAMLGVAASGEPLAAVVALPFAFLPLVLMGFAVEKTKRFIEYRRLVVGKWLAKRPEGEWRLQFTDDGTLILNDALVARYVLYGNLELAASDQVRAILGERIVSLSEGELVVTVNGSVCRFTRAA
jgi:hypothetical protein